MGALAKTLWCSPALREYRSRPKDPTGLHRTSEDSKGEAGVFGRLGLAFVHPFFEVIRYQGLLLIKKVVQAGIPSQAWNLKSKQTVCISEINISYSRMILFSRMVPYSRMIPRRQMVPCSRMVPFNRKFVIVWGQTNKWVLVPTISMSWVREYRKLDGSLKACFTLWEERAVDATKW